MKAYYVYMMANKYNNVLYVGVTNNLIRRVYEHKTNLVDGFTSKYKCHKLVWFEKIEDIETAIIIEKRMKKWKREYKENVINEMNPEWKDVYQNLLE
ncbi:GIY-YIG nuclease family protein [candidate division KSB1 bacterium]|nr:GIY-YIG nuclease family protein [candidate division KSB1 bacterium]NIR71640.1 GIY-YIG nuclease family protein [candidate division KSB1 bacterium]NIS23459.1 GIY-YIG nuclease family protein [candidate division KSB1 bacterium]NIT70369.1 GIY-YIG nuclease family protein [candidate division KSB1 bacterium]NIU24068.1 GIY-YIG nuclease family protein [candidate division KSB1 bacterium]